MELILSVGQLSCSVCFSLQSKQPYPWIVIAISIPFFIIGINMGTVRQGLALSIILVGLTQIDKSPGRYILYNFFSSLIPQDRNSYVFNVDF